MEIRERALRVVTAPPTASVLDALAAGAPTLVGPLPHTDAVAAARFGLVLEQGLVPLPSLPRIDPSSMFPAAALRGLHGVRIEAEGGVSVTASELPSVEAVLDGGGFAPASTGEDPGVTAARVVVGELQGRPIRVPVPGPVTLAMTLRLRGVESEVAARLGTALSHRRVVETVGPLVGAGVSPVLMLMEPGLIGSSHPTFPYPPEVIEEMILRAREAAPGVPFGIHVPGRTDLATLVATGPALLSVPVQDWVTDSAEAVDALLAAGGRVAWGAVPVDQPLGTTEEFLWRRLSALWCSLARAGVDPMLVRSASLVGPADGLGHFGVPQAELVRELVMGVSRRVRNQTLTARLTIGA